MTPTNVHRRRRMNHNILTGVFFVLCVVIAASVAANPGDAMILLSKLMNLALYWTAVSLFTIFYKTRQFNVEDKLSENPVALGIFLGCFALGTALVAIFG